MRKAEQLIWDAMRRNAPNSAWLSRIENSAAEGMPDVYACMAMGAQPRWVELKAAKRPKRGTTKVLGLKGLRPSQINWHIKAASMGVSSYILIRDDAGELFLIPGKMAAVVNDFRLTDLRICSVGQVTLGWAEVFEVLR